VLDSARYRTFLASELGVSTESVSAMVLGGMATTWSDSQLHDSRWSANRKLIATKRLEEIEKRTRGGGGEIVELMKRRRTTRRHPVYKMVEAYMLDRKSCCRARVS